MKILIVTTSASALDAQHPTGTWFEEFAVPYTAFEAAGASIVVASPLGGPAPLDPKTEPDEGARKRWATAIAALADTVRLSYVRSVDFDALFIPGGHGPMVDLAHDADIHRLIGEFDVLAKIVGAVCHGPAALVHARNAHGRPFVEGRRVTGFTNNEEQLAGLDRVVPFLLEDALKGNGAIFDGTPIPFAPHVVRDLNLITGGNPSSSEPLAKEFLAALRDAERV